MTLTTLEEKEQRIREIGRPWTDLMEGFRYHRRLTAEEKKSPHSDAIARSRQDYYAKGVQVILGQAIRLASGKRKSK